MQRDLVFCPLCGSPMRASRVSKNTFSLYCNEVTAKSCQLNDLINIRIKAENAAKALESYKYFLHLVHSGDKI